MNRTPLTLMKMAGAVLLAMLAFASPATADDHDDDDNHELGTYVHEGGCDDVGSEVEDIADLERNDDELDERVVDLILGDNDMPDPFWSEEDDVDMPLDELTDGEYVVTVHEGDDSDTPVIACGMIEGELDENGGLLIDLDEHEDSGYEGRAYLMPDDDDDDDDETDVHVGVWEVQVAGV